MATNLVLGVFMVATLGTQSVKGLPAIGDILLEPYSNSDLQGFYKVKVQFSNGVDRPGYGGICADGSYREEATVICNQLGYTYLDFAYRVIDDLPVWLKDVTCDQSNLHILRCNYDIVVGSERTNPSTCGPTPNKLLIKCDFTKPLSPYNGKLALCPPDNATSGPNERFSVSFGIVSLYLASHDTWRGIDTKTLLGITEANAICRQMGFTGAQRGSAVALSATDQTFNGCFDETRSDLLFRLHHGSWMKSSTLQCNDGPQRCFGCCYTYPSEDACEDCQYSNTLVITCTFDPSEAKLSTGTAGSEQKCKLNSEDKVMQCESGCSKETIASQKAGLIIEGIFLLILGPFGIVCLGYLYKRWLHERCCLFFRRFRHGYQPPDQQNRDNEDN